MKKLFLFAVLALILTTVGYGQPYQPEHLWAKEGAENEDWFGYNMAGIGDVNVDQCEDFLVSNKFPGSYEAHVCLFYGGNPPDTTADLVFHNPYPYGVFGRRVENIGDVNNDDYDDFAIQGGYTQDDVYRVFIYYGGSLLDTIPDVVLSEGTLNDVFGTTIEGVGDANGDGYDDLAVQAGGYGEGRGKVWVYFGGSPMDSIADWVQEGSRIQAGFGRSIAGDGDLNGDGYDDFVIYEALDYPHSWGTTYWIYFGSSQLDTIPDVCIDGEEYYPEIDISSSSALIINLNPDHFSDLVIVAGRTYNSVVFYGGDPMDTNIDLVLTEFSSIPLSYDMLVSSTGDVNRDGYGDVIVSQWGAYGNAGLVNLYLGSPWMNGQPEIHWTGQQNPWYACGRTLTDIGDVNGDGVDDIVFGSSIQANRGRVDIFAGDTSFVADVPQENVHPIPTKFRLLPPYPNPFNSTVTIPFNVFGGVTDQIHLKIYNVLGQEVEDLTADVRKTIAGLTAGQAQVIWDGKDATGLDSGSGVYLVELKVGSMRHIQKVVLLR